MRSWLFHYCWLAAGVAALTCSFWYSIGVAAPLADEYLLQPGDVVDFSVAALPNLNKRMSVSIDGKINVPLVGWVDAAKKSIQEVEDQIRLLIPDAIYRQRVNGDELRIVVRSDEVALDVWELRPLYLGGDVARPGEIAFRPGLTVRQALAIAGGLEAAAATDIGRLRDAAELRGRYASLMKEYVSAVADLLRYEAEKAGSDKVDSQATILQDLPSTEQTDVIKTAEGRLVAQDALELGERGYLEAAIQQNAQRVAILREQQSREQEGVEADKAELGRIQSLADSGAVQETRVAEARRQLLASSTRALETRAELANAEIRQADLLRQLDRIDEQRSITVLEALQAATLTVARLSAELKGITEEISLLPSPLMSEGSAATMITLFRDGNNAGAVGMSVGLDEVLQPGDYLDVRVVEGVGVNPAEG